MNKNKQNLRKGQKFHVQDLDNQVNANQNTKSYRTRKQVEILKTPFSKQIKPSEKQRGNEKNARNAKQLSKGTNKKASKICISSNFDKEDVCCDRLINELVLENGKQNAFKRVEKDDGSSITNEDKKLQSQNVVQQNFILDMIALQARSELRFQLDWKNHELQNEEISQYNNNIWKIWPDESCDQDSVICSSYFSIDKEIIKNCEIQKNNMKEIKTTNQKIEKLEEQYSIDLNKVKFEDNNTSCSKDQYDQIEFGILQTITAEDEQNSIQQDDKSEKAKNFYHFLNEATYENPSRASCKEIHKLIRLRHDKFCVDVFEIDHIWSDLQDSKVLNELSFQKYLKCIQDMHDQDLLWLDPQKRKVYLI
ncbi:unnamed protein product [Paramecium octaurelia]|uniref:Uncharacterized protein n=1 Tax=Paramecium octaurelia TaxID=43137 RepID=A0A8S1U8A2_PAROT|nr:unnamed protein product [Paramecium octaurelia]